MTAPVPDHAALTMEQLRVTPPTAPTLTLFHNDCDWVVAASPEDAFAVCKEFGMEPPDDAPWEQWEPWGEERPLTMTFVDEPGDEKTTLTGAEWAAKGRGYLGSTEY
jgi:hypothetical protein